MNKACKKIREDILKISHASGHGHIPTCFSVVEILYAVYDYMRHDPTNPNWNDRDIFILSKGHAALAYYCVLAEFGYFPVEKVYSFGGFQSDFGCHADRFKISGIEASTGSLGHGIGLAVGVSLGIRLKNDNRQVYTVIGDGESNEGTVWESLMVADNLGLDNLTILYDNNMSHSRGLQINNPAEKLKAFGCQVMEVDGHDVEAIRKALATPQQGPKAIVANTVKGFGCRLLSENQYEWHRKSPTDEQLRELLEELNAAAI
ncbi:MAG: transketolase [Deltaproteobacteria bacterium]|nr:transketolase [Deltaproteobacteria bacterium]